MIVDLDYSGTLDVHSITPAVGDFVRVPTDVAMYHHYRGDPLAAGGERIRGAYKDSGSPSFNKEDYSMKKYLLFNEE